MHHAMGGTVRLVTLMVGLIEDGCGVESKIEAQRGLSSLHASLSARS